MAPGKPWGRSGFVPHKPRTMLHPLRRSGRPAFGVSVKSRLPSKPPRQSAGSPHLRRGVPVPGQGGGRTRVAQPLLGDLERLALGDGQRGTGVAQIIEVCCLRLAEALAQPAEVTANPVGHRGSGRSMAFMMVASHGHALVACWRR